VAEGPLDPAGASSGVRLCEVVAAIAIATDLGMGQPLEHILRSSVIATRLADHLGASPEDRDAAYWVTLFYAAGCTGVSFEMANLFGDDIEFRAGIYDVGPSNTDRLRYLLGRAGRDRSGLGRWKVRADLLRRGLSQIEQTFLAHCAVSAALAERLGLGDVVVTSLLQTFEAWNGKGFPQGLAGEEILLPIRIAALAYLVEVRDRTAGWAATCDMVRADRGDLDPGLAAAWCDVAEEILAGVDLDSSWEQVMAAQPAGRGPLSQAELDDALALLADYADLKSPWFTGHSRAVASLAVAAGRELSLPEAELVTLRRAALVHDIGRNGVSNTIWDKPGPLTEAEYERVRLHAYYTDRVLHRASRLALLASIASAAHERADGSGYPRAVPGSTVPLLGRVIAAADMYQAMLEHRPHRPARGRDEAAGALRQAARDGELDPAAADAVLAAAGHPVRRKPSAPAGLTPREVEVLALVSRGMTTKAVAAELGITAKTAGNHIERIYQKAEVSSRAEAAMFAMRHGLLPDWESGET
jgi:HD-GYP domain-containing protein (c-di-GMP phosphodiesterase class II)